MLLNNDKVNFSSLNIKRQGLLKQQGRWDLYPELSHTGPLLNHTVSVFEKLRQD